MTSSPTSLASTPPVGWNSWDMFRQDIRETSIRETTNALACSELKELMLQPNFETLALHPAPI
jgi:hypothetical protein